MSDWTRSGRADDQRRYGEDRDRWGFGGRDRQSSEGRWGEGRSFGAGDERNAARRAVEEWDDPQRAYGDQGAGSRAYGRQEYAGGERREQDRGYRSIESGGGGYGGRDYGGQDYGQGYQGQGYGSQDYQSQSYGQRGRERDYGDHNYGERSFGERNYGVGGAGRRDLSGRSYGDEDRYAGRFGQGYGDYRQSSRYGERGGGFPRNEPLARVTDGDTDHGMRANMGMGEHRGRGPKNYTRSDDRIREDVNDRLTEDSWVDASSIDVQVSKCEVTLTGTVNSREEKRRAEDIADRVSGVKHVQNNLRVEQASAQTGQSGASQSGASMTGAQTTGAQAIGAQATGAQATGAQTTSSQTTGAQTRATGQTHS